MSIPNNKKAQVALITVMIIATVLTVILSVTFQTTVDTQMTKIEEENQKALAAAEAAVELSIKENANTSVGQGSLESISGFTGGATIADTTSNNLTTERIDKNGQYTFYLADYDPDTKILGTTSAQEAVTVCFQSGSPNPAIEIHLLKTNSIKRYAVDPNTRISNKINPSASCPATGFQYSYTVPAADIGTNTRLMVVKNLFNGSKLYFQRTSNFPLQGKAATGEVNSDTGVSKKIYLFQTYPQIPADFFSTSL